MTALVQRLCRRSSSLPFVMGVGAGAAVGVATHDLAIWLALGAGLGIAFSADRRGC